VKLRDLKLVEEFDGADGRLRFATTAELLQRFGLESLQELTMASLSGNPPAKEGPLPRRPTPTDADEDSDQRAWMDW
jgi:hypothetical protein